MADSSRGKLVVISGPSGVGKSCVVERLLQCASVPLVLSVSATTRPPRQGEVDGVHYHFLSDEEFAQRRKRGEFLECFEVFGRGHWYGTLLSEVTPRLEDGKWVILTIDVHGAEAVARRFPDAVTIFLRPQSLPQLEEQLRGRKTETEQSIHRRLQEAQAELARANQYRYQVINDTVEHAVKQICHILAQSGG